MMRRSRFARYAHGVSRSRGEFAKAAEACRELAGMLESRTARQAFADAAELIEAAARRQRRWLRITIGIILGLVGVAGVGLLSLLSGSQ